MPKLLIAKERLADLISHLEKAINFQNLKSSDNLLTLVINENEPFHFLKLINYILGICLSKYLKNYSHYIENKINQLFIFRKSI